MVDRHRARDRDPARRARGPGRGARAGRERPRAVGDDPQRRRRSCTRATGSSTCPGYGAITYDMAFGGNFYAITPAADAGLVVDPARSRRADRGRPGDDGGDQRGRPPGAPGGPADRRLPPRRLPRAGPRRRRRGRRDLDPPGLAGPLARAGPGTSARMAQLHARGELALGRAVRQPVRDRHPLHRPRSSRRRPSAASPRSSPRSPAAPGSPAWASTCWTPRTRFPGLRAVCAAELRRAARASTSCALSREANATPREPPAGPRSVTPNGRTPSSARPNCGTLPGYAPAR